MNSVGKPDAANPHVRFDERGRETEPLAKPQRHRALPRLYNSGYVIRLPAKRDAAIEADTRNTLAIDHQPAVD